MREFKYVCLLSLVISIFISSGLAGDWNELVHREIYFTSVPKVSSAPKIDGNLDDACWQEGTKITEFLLTAGKHGTPAENQTTCYLLYDDTHLYVAFKCEEPDISGIKTTCKIWDDLDILYDDRVEIFLDINHDHRSYFELAVNPAGVQFDQKGFNRFHGSKTCDMDSEWNCFWRAKTSIGQDEWIAEISIDVTSYGIERIEEGMTWGLNLSRVRQPDVNKGDEFFKRKPGGSAEYSAWAPVEDYIRETISNFHAPIEFGDLVFGKPGFKIKRLSFRSALYAFGPVGYPSLFGKNPLEIIFDKLNQEKKDIMLKLTVEPPSVEKWELFQKIMLNYKEPIKTFYYIPEDRENKIVIQIFDPKTERQLYRTSYIEVASPFIEFNLEPLYSRSPQKIESVSFRLLTDDETRKESMLALKFCDKKTEQEIDTSLIRNLAATADFTLVFDIEKLRDLPGGNYYIDCKLKAKEDQQLKAHFRQNLTKFEKELPKKFQAIEGQYSYGGLTDHAIRIRYPFPAEFVFWRKASYIPWWDVDQAAMTNEFVECWGAGNQGCCEPMQDRECRFSRVELVETSPARAVVHWRYALSDPHYRIYQNEWVDEYYVLYPDGVGVRQVNLWPNSSTRHEMFEALLAKPPAVQTEQLFEEKFATLATLEGEGYSNKYFYKNKTFYKEFLQTSNDFIVQIHFRDRMHPFTVFSLRENLMPGVTRDHITVCSRIISGADRRGHWPASRYQIDGYNTVGLDVPHHGNIGNVQAEVNPENQPTTWTFLIGVADRGSDKPIAHGKSWLYPADIEILDENFAYDGFDFSQRAYLITSKKTSSLCKITIKTPHSIINPVFIFENSTGTIKQVKLDNKILNEQLVKVGPGHDGKLVLFLKTEMKDDQNLGVNFR